MKEWCWFVEKYFKVGSKEEVSQESLRCLLEGWVAAVETTAPAACAGQKTLALR